MFLFSLIFYYFQTGARRKPPNSPLARLTLTLILIHPASNWTHWSTLRRHPCLSRAATSASSQLSPIFCRSLLAVVKLHFIKSCLLRSPCVWFIEELKQGLRAETQSWRTCYARYCNAKYRDLMNEALRFIGDVGRRLARPITDLSDVRLVVDTLCELRLREIDVDMTIGPIEVSMPALS